MSKCWLIVENEASNPEYHPRRIVIYGRNLMEAIKDNMDIFRHDEWVSMDNPTVKEVYNDFNKRIKSRNLSIFSSNDHINERG